MKQTQLLHGVLEGCVLAILAKTPTYGYALMQALHDYGFTSIAGGTLYPLLAKLEASGDLVGSQRESPDGPARKYFALTAQGEARLFAFEAEWAQFGAQVARVLADAAQQEENNDQ
ncbi:PadR family transcriptional regulator [Lacticaseibacillus kribbianus]|uniref:PadR family transcriptional regulator n=1 Tax=Lacticaseibacillus kribbianus TaxID=2926292 RepID=UPI001CD70AD7|nr:PadR family transcriptional regulator [Lacticaseibacillus kribbianus]